MRLSSISVIRHRRRQWLFKLLLIPLLCFIAYELHISACELTVSSYEIAVEKLDTDLRILQLSDIHGSVFGENNCRLVQAVEEQSPDLILITGDLVNSKRKAAEDADMACDLIRQLTEIAPVYACYGNQETELDSLLQMDLEYLYEEAGAVCLQEEYIDLEIKGQALRIGGIYGYCLPEKYATAEEQLKQTLFLRSFEKTDACKILLCHMPVSWLCYGSLYDYDVDLVYSGHSHGGQVRFPWIRWNNGLQLYTAGLWAPDQGWFPGEMSGVYETEEDADKSYLILSRGLGNTDWVPRFNNIPEILVTDLGGMR